MLEKMMVYIPTLKREEKQFTLQSIPERWKSRTFLVCPPNEKHDWENIIYEPRPMKISEKRQYILDQSPSNFVAQLDDDLFFYKREQEGKSKRTRMDNCGEMLDLMESWLQQGDVYCGISNSFMCQNNPTEYYYGKPSFSLFVNKNFLSLNNIQFNKLDYFEDFHIPLSVLECGKRLRFSGDFIVDQKKANAPGGCSVFRNEESNRQAMIELQKLHPRYVFLQEKKGAKNQGLVVNLEMKIAFAKAYKDNVDIGGSLEKFFD